MRFPISSRRTIRRVLRRCRKGATVTIQDMAWRVWRTYVPRSVDEVVGDVVYRALAHDRANGIEQ